MVMAGNEAASGALTEDTLSARLQWLRQRREALQKKLAQKNNELKSLCVEEAELTGILPPEIPLEPGESPPTFRRKVGTTFTYPQNLINKLKSSEAEESALELERQVQIGIVEAALGIINDPTESKAVRRKHRLVYQQSQRRLQELEARLNFIRQSRGKSYRTSQVQQPTTFNSQPQLHNNVKHRSKKPRPPLENTATDASTKLTRNIMQETGVSLSPLGSTDKCNTYPGHPYDEQLTTNVCNHNHASTYCPTSPTEPRQNIKIIEHDHNDNQNVYILPDQYRGRTYSHGSGGSRGHYADSERTYRPVPNTYTEEERQLRYRQFQQMQLQDQIYTPQQYTEYKHLDNDIQRRSGQIYYDRDFRTLHHTHLSDIPTYYKNSTQSQSSQRRDREIGIMGGKNMQYMGSYEAQLPPGYWVRYGDEIVWCTDDPPVADRFGSLDRRRRNALQHTASAGADVQPRYRTGGVNKNSGSALSQNASVHLLPLTEQPSANSKMLLRTQSLGSVETWNSGQSRDAHESKDITDHASRKVKEKEWYETSLDSGASPGLDLSLIAVHKTSQYQSSPSASVKILNNGGEDSPNSYVSSVNRRKTDLATESEHLQPLPVRYEQPRKKVLEIPAESKPQQDPNDESIALSSSQTCTIVQAGKYQPYREVTKPFEMSDFYKYSTKFRKRNETVAAGQPIPNETQETVDMRGCRHSENNDLLNDATPANAVHNSVAAVQKRIYQPVQRMTCQPYMTSMR